MGYPCHFQLNSPRAFDGEELFEPRPKENEALNGEQQRLWEGSIMVVLKIIKDVVYE